MLSREDKEKFYSHKKVWVKLNGEYVEGEPYSHCDIGSDEPYCVKTEKMEIWASEYFTEKPVKTPNTVSIPEKPTREEVIEITEHLDNYMECAFILPIYRAIFQVFQKNTGQIG